MSFCCSACFRISHNPEDKAHQYCGACHAFGVGQSPTFASFMQGRTREHESNRERQKALRERCSTAIEKLPCEVCRVPAGQTCMGEDSDAILRTHYLRYRAANDG